MIKRDSCCNGTFALVGICVGEALCLTRLTAKKTPKVRPHFVLASVLNCVALGALLDENLLSLFNVTHVFLEAGKTIEERTVVTSSTEGHSRGIKHQHIKQYQFINIITIITKTN